MNDEFKLSIRADWMDEVKTPRVASAGVVEDPTRTKILMVKRKFPPLGYALPGGMMEIGETIAEAAQRETKEETGIEAKGNHLISVSSSPQSDPRWHVIIHYVLMKTEENKEPKGMDDAAEAFWMDYKSDKLMDDIINSSKKTILAYRNWREHGGDLLKVEGGKDD